MSKFLKTAIAAAALDPLPMSAQAAQTASIVSFTINQASPKLS